MPSAVSLVRSEIPDTLFESAGLADLVHDRGGEKEVWFYWRAPAAVLPVFLDGRLQLVAWGSKDRKGPLPCTGWTWRNSVERGAWVGLGCEVEPAVIRASFVYDGGIWYPVAEGVHGLLVRPPEMPPVVYMVCEEPTRYYRVMTRGTREPWLIDEVL